MKILLVDDHVLFAESLKIALEDFPEIQGFVSTRNTEGLLTLLRRENPDILLMDINLGDKNREDKNREDGLLLAKRILESQPDQIIVMLSGYDLPVYRREARKIGAKGFVNKEVEPGELVDILGKILNGTEFFPSERIFVEDLTDTEKKVLEMVAMGMKRKEIAKKLFGSERTVSNHLQHIFEKLQVNSAVEAVTKGIQMGYITLDFKQ